MAASVWFSVLVLILIQQVFARDCSDIGSLKNCNECIRCGGTWCNDVSESIRCLAEKNDQWCPTSKAELLPSVYSNKPTDNKFIDKSIVVGDSGMIEVSFQHTSPNPQVTITVTNSSLQNSDSFVYNYKTNCKNGICATTIIAEPSINFCPLKGTIDEYVVLKIRADGLNEDIATAKYHVPCACDSTQGTTSKSVEKMSVRCNGQGDYVADAFTIYGCTCYDGRYGTYCEKNQDDNYRRGDISSCVHPATNLVCSNNGLCNHETGSCECFTDSEGSQYYDVNEYCADICTTSNLCDSCLRDPALGPCRDCHILMHIDTYNKTLMANVDEQKRKVWIECKEVTDECVIQYAAMKDEADVTHIMVINSCQGVFAPHIAGGLNITVPVILGIVALVAAAAAVAGFMLWKNRAPPLPLTDPQYQNIGAEDCTGENPLYKPPTSSFKNPTYGKW